MNTLLRRFQEHSKRKNFFSKNQTILLACSGGLDSMVLADLLLKSGFPIALSHCNFRLRGDAADADEALVAVWANANSLPFFTTTFDTQLIADARGQGIQQVARELRYSWLEMLRSDHGFAHIITAHHAGDVAETLLMNLMRGTGIAGLHGVPERNGFVVRPLLFAEKHELKEYALLHKIDWREDASNHSNDYTRNAIRNILLPEMEKLFPQAAKQISYTAGHLAQVEMLYNETIEKHRKKLIEKRGKDWYIPIRKLQKVTGWEAVLYELLQPFGFTAAQTPEAIKLFDGERSKGISSATTRLIFDRNFFILTKTETQQSDLVIVEKGIQAVAAGDQMYSLQEVPVPKGLNIEATAALIAAESLEWPLVLRRRRTGDYFYPLGMNNKKKKVGRFLNDLKLPAHIKENVWILESNHRIVWVSGYRLDERFKVRPSTKEVLCVEVSALAKS